MKRAGIKSGIVSRILIVDDDIFCRTAISLLFEKRGFDVRVADSGEEALAMIMKDEDKYDLIFVDLEMPRRSGFELARKLRRDHVDVLVFVVSGFQDKMMFVEMLRKDCKKVSVDITKQITTTPSSALGE